MDELFRATINNKNNELYVFFDGCKGFARGHAPTRSTPQ